MCDVTLHLNEFEDARVRRKAPQPSTMTPQTQSPLPQTLSPETPTHKPSTLDSGLSFHLSGCRVEGQLRPPTSNPKSLNPNT